MITNKQINDWLDDFADRILISVWYDKLNPPRPTHTTRTPPGGSAEDSVCRLER